LTSTKIFKNQKVNLRRQKMSRTWEEKTEVCIAFNKENPFIIFGASDEMLNGVITGGLVNLYNQSDCF
jgi:hypothetical protein